MQELRAARRFQLPLSFRFQIPGDAEKATHQGQVQDISYCGVYFFTERELKPGTELNLSFRLPGETAGSKDGVMVQAVGKVLRVEPRIVNGAPLQGIAVALQKYEFVRAAA